ncbi:radical SAM protein [bacterium]|nr:radical SAM protein [bacterium]
MNEIYLLSPYCDEEYALQDQSTGYIRYYLADNGYNSIGIDLAKYDHDYKYICKVLSDKESPIVGITGYTRERFHAYRLIRSIRKACPSAHIIVGGHHFGYLPEESLKNIPEIDIVVKGEGEITFKKICDAVTKNLPISEIKGISYRVENLLSEGGFAIESNPDEPLEKDLDKFRSWDIEEYKKHYKTELSTPKTAPSQKFIRLMATRGCPSNCNFCSLVTDSVRYRSVKDILDEIEGKMKISGLRHVSFGDSSLTVNKNFVRALCDGILERNLNIKWNCYSRADIRLDVLDYMAKAGCISVEVALESGSPRILKSIGKFISLEKYLAFVKRAHGLGIKVWSFLLLSSTDETIEDARMTLDLLKKSAPYVYDFGLQVTRILPDTQLDRIARERGVLPKDFSWFEDYKNPYEKLLKTESYTTLPIYLEKMTIEDLQEILTEFDSIKEREFVYPDGLWKVIKGNLKFKQLKKVSLSVVLYKVKRLLIMILNITKTSKKIKYFKESNELAKSVDRPNWQVFKIKEW